MIGDVPIDSEACVDFVNFDDPLDQSLEDANWSQVACVYVSICVCTMFHKKII